MRVHLAADVVIMEYWQ